MTAKTSKPPAKIPALLRAKQELSALGQKPPARKQAQPAKKGNRK